MNLFSAERYIHIISLFQIEIRESVTISNRGVTVSKRGVTLSIPIIKKKENNS